jgi:hypothetical protein
VTALPCVTLRSRSRNRHAVILDGENSKRGELVLIRGQGITVAELTIQNVKWNGFKIAAELGAQRATIYNCVIHNIWQRGVKAPHIPPDRPQLYLRSANRCIRRRSCSNRPERRIDPLQGFNLVPFFGHAAPVKRHDARGGLTRAV